MATTIQRGRVVRAGRRALGMLVAVAGIAGCVGTNPEWDGPASATDAWTPTSGSRCDELDAGTGSTDTGEHASEASEASDACGAVEPDACGDALVACASEGGWFCADLRTHDEHCGACFHDCAAYGDASCDHGECRCDGGPWWRLCGAQCTDTRTDPAACGVHCLDCRVAYGADARCDAGACAPGWGG